MIKYQTILDLCASRGVKVSTVEKELGFSKSALSKVEVNTPNAEKIFALAQYFDVPMEYFFEEADKEKVARYASLIASASNHVANYDADLEDEVEADMRRQPVYEVAAGQGRVNGQYADEYTDEEMSDEYCLCTVHGDSMYPVLFDGDVVKVHYQTVVESSDIAIVKVDGETATAKYVEVADNGVWLRAENKSVFEDKFYSVQEVLSLPITIIGKVVELRREL